MFKVLFFSGYAFSDKESAITDYVEKLNALYDFLIYTSVLFCVGIVIGFLYFSWKFKRKAKDEIGQAKVHHNIVLEAFWQFIPFVIFMVVFVWGAVLYHDSKKVPENSLEIHVYGQMWSWEFIYKNGKKTVNEFYVPKGRSVKLIMTSRDVIHSFFIPTFRIKQDVVPGLYTSLWFRANKTGNFHIFCAEYCGDGHSIMLAKVRVVPLKEWETWLANDPYKGMTLSEIGQKTFEGRCTVCHSTSKEKLIGPGLGGIFKTRRELSNGRTVFADENYIRKSILNPSAELVQGFANQMTPFAGLLSEEELSGLIEYIKTLK